MGRALLAGRDLLQLATLLQIGEPLLHVERLAAPQQIEVTHGIAAAPAQQHQGQLVAVTLKAHRAALAPVQRLHLDPPLRPRLRGQGEIVNILLKIKNSFLPTKQILIGL